LHEAFVESGRDGSKNFAFEHMIVRYLTIMTDPKVGTPPLLLMRAIHTHRSPYTPLSVSLGPCIGEESIMNQEIVLHVQLGQQVTPGLP
jgi:hypothetical protein